MGIYFAIKGSETGPTLYVGIEEAKDILESMAKNRAECSDEEKYSFEVIEMTKEEFENLPEFQGF